MSCSISLLIFFTFKRLFYRRLGTYRTSCFYIVADSPLHFLIFIKVFKTLFDLFFLVLFLFLFSFLFIFSSYNCFRFFSVTSLIFFVSLFVPSSSCCSSSSSLSVSTLYCLFFFFFKSFFYSFFFFNQVYSFL